MSATIEVRANQLARDERRLLDRVIVSLSERFPRATHSAIERTVDRRYLEFYGAPIREYIPIMVERESAADLRAQLGAVPLHKGGLTS